MVHVSTQQEFSDADFRIVDNADQSKKVAFEVSGVTTAITRTLTVPNASGTIALTSDLTSGYQPLDADLTSWAAITRASGFDTFVATPSSANFASLITDETGTAGTVPLANVATWTPTFTAGSGTPTTVTLTAATSIKVGRLVVATLAFTVTTVGTATNGLRFTLPYSGASSAYGSGAMREYVNTGLIFSLTIESGGAFAELWRYDNSTPWVANNAFKGSIAYISAS